MAQRYGVRIGTPRDVVVIRVKSTDVVYDVVV
jgi:hypothetical protein